MKREAQAARRALEGMEKEGVRRTLRTVEEYTRPGLTTHVRVEGRELVNFCSNDYLGLARDPRVTAAMTTSAKTFGVGSGAAHLVTGHTIEHQRLEAELADLTGREAALLFSTGYMANLGILTALIGRGGLVLEDRLNHASLIDGALLSGARLSRYAHANVGDAMARLDKAEEEEHLIATDGVFSMDGDIAPLRELALAAQAQHALLYVDDAHGVGVVGPDGRGSVAAARLSGAAPLQLVTLGKALGGYGAAVLGDADLIEHLAETARPYVYTTALPPAQAAASLAAVKLARREGWRRDKLLAQVAQFRRLAAQRGLELLPSDTPIQPLLCVSDAQALAMAAALEQQGFWVAAIRPPTVPEGRARLRVTLSALHAPEDIEALVDALAVATERVAAAADVAQDAIPQP